MPFRLTIAMAGHPRGKGRGRAFVHKGTGRVTVMTPGATRTYENQLRYAGQQEMAGRLPTALPLRVHVEAVFAIAATWPKKKKAAALLGHVHPCTTPDADNLLKILDGLNGVVWVDDKQIVEATVRKIYGEAPSLTIQVEAIGPVQVAA